MSKLKSTLFASVGAAAMLLAPLAVLPITSLPAGYAALAEKGGNGKGGGNGGGNGGGSGSESRGNSDNAGKNEDKAAAREESKADKTKNLNSQLGRLNSLKRNINGLMNSSDPHMADVRAYVQANAALDAAEAALLVEQGEYNTALEAFGAVVTTAAIDSYDDYDYSTATTDTLRQRLIDLQSLDVADPDYAAAQTEAALVSDLLATPEAAALDVADGELTAAQDDVTEATVGTTDADLQAALEAAANKDGDITPEMLAWAKAQLGID